MTSTSACGRWASTSAWRAGRCGVRGEGASSGPCAAIVSNRVHAFGVVGISAESPADGVCPAPLAWRKRLSNESVASGGVGTGPRRQQCGARSLSARASLRDGVAVVLIVPEGASCVCQRRLDVRPPYALRKSCLSFSRRTLGRHRRVTWPKYFVVRPLSWDEFAQFRLV